MNSNIKTIKSNKADNKKNLLQTLVNFGTVLLFVIILVIIYKYLIFRDTKNLINEGFENEEELMTDFFAYLESSFGDLR